MFEVGSYIVHGLNGVCKVEAIGDLRIPSAPRGKLYYTLAPCGDSESRLFVPVEHPKVAMRSIMKKEDALELLKSIGGLPEMESADERSLETRYKEMLKGTDPRELLCILKTIYHRMEQRRNAGRKLTASDERFFRAAGELLYGELAVALGTDAQAAERLVMEQLARPGEALHESSR